MTVGARQLSTSLLEFERGAELIPVGARQLSTSLPEFERGADARRGASA